MKKNKGRGKAVYLAVTLTVVTLFSCAFLIVNSGKNIRDDASWYSATMTSEKAAKTEEYITERQNELKTLVLNMANGGTIPDKTLFQNIVTYTASGTNGNEDEHQALLDKTAPGVTEVYERGGLQVFSIYVPIHDDEITGAAAVMPVSSILVHSEILFYKAGEESCIADQSGNIIIGSFGDGEKNVFDMVKSWGDAEAFAPFNGSLANTGSAKWLENKKCSAYVARIAGTPWYMAGFVTQEAAEAYTKSQQVLSIVSSVFILLSFVVMLIIGSKYIGKARRDFEKSYGMDPLLNIPSYNKFVLDVDSTLADNAGYNFAIVYFDIDNFKQLNSSFGFVVCDGLLKHFAKTLKAEANKYDIVGHSYADHFMLLMMYNKTSEIDKRIVKVSEQIATFPQISAENVSIRLSAGVYCTEGRERISCAQMLDNAVVARNSVRNSFNAAYAIYDDEMRERFTRISDLSNGLETGIKNNEFQLYFQPKFSLKKKTIDGAEVLSRWNNPKYSSVSPGEFITLFEKTGDIVAFDRYVFEQTCRTVRKWVDSGRKVVPLAVNMSRISLNRADFLKDLREIKRKYHIADGFIELEFTESADMVDYDRLSGILNEMRKSGFMIAMDDFGEGYSTIRAIKELNMDVLKLDKFFLKTINDDRSRLILQGIINIASSLGIKTIAEGVETEESLRLLAQLGCDTIQGYLYSMPIKEDQFLEFMNSPIPPDFPVIK